MLLWQFFLTFVWWLAQRTYSRKLKRRLQSEVAVCARIATLGSEVLEKTNLSVLEKLVLEIGLFEMEAGISTAKETLGDRKTVSEL
jgi:hypothetical protein